MSRKSQFERRKEREQEETNGLIQERESKREEVTEKKSQSQFTNKSFDVVESENGKYDMVTIEYNPETKLAKVVDQKRIDRTIGMIFLRRKIAMESLK